MPLEKPFIHRHIFYSHNMTIAELGNFINEKKWRPVKRNSAIQIAERESFPGHWIGSLPVVAAAGLFLFAIVHSTGQFVSGEFCQMVYPGAERGLFGTAWFYSLATNMRDPVCRLL